MKKTVLFSLIMLLTSPAFAALDETGRTTDGPVKRVGYVVERGIEGLVGTIPCDIPKITVKEFQDSKWVAPISVLPRILTLVPTRVVSSIHDIVIMPFMVPFTNDLSPVTEAFDMPEFACRKG